MIDFRRNRDFGNIVCWAVIGLIASIFLVSTVLIKSLLFHNFNFFAYDLGIHMHALWKTAFTFDLFNTVRGMNTLGDHVWLINYLVAPFYRFSPRAETLFMVQSTSHALCGVLIAQFSFKISRSMILASAMAISTLMHPALWNMNLESFHPETIALPFIMACFMAAYHCRWRIFWICFVLSLICKEDIAITQATLAVWVFFFRDRKQGALAFLFASLWLAFLMKVVLPQMNGVGFFRNSGKYWFHGLMPGSINWDLVRQRAENEENWTYLLDLLGPAGIFGLMRPDILLLAAPSFIINCLSGVDYLRSIDYHYNNQTLAFVWVAQASGAVLICEAIFSGSKLTWQLKRFGIALLICLFSFMSYPQISSNIESAFSAINQALYPNMTAAQVEFAEVYGAFADSPDVSVSTNFSFVPNFANRRRIYMFPNPWIPRLWGISDQFLGEAPPQPQILILRSNEIEKELALIKHHPCQPNFLWSGQFLTVYFSNMGC